MYFLAILHVGTIQNEGGGKFCPNSRKTYKSKNNFRPYISATPVDSTALLLGFPVLCNDNEVLQKIGDGSSSECTSLENIKLPPTVNEIGGNAFYGCSNLREVELKGVPQNF